MIAHFTSLGHLTTPQKKKKNKKKKKYYISPCHAHQDPTMATNLIPKCYCARIGNTSVR